MLRAKNVNGCSWLAAVYRLITQHKKFKGQLNPPLVTDNQLSNKVITILQ